MTRDRKSKVSGKFFSIDAHEDGGVKWLSVGSVVQIFHTDFNFDGTSEKAIGAEDLSLGEVGIVASRTGGLLVAVLKVALIRKRGAVDEVVVVAVVGSAEVGAVANFILVVIHRTNGVVVVDERRRIGAGAQIKIPGTARVHRQLASGPAVAVGDRKHHGKKSHKEKETASHFLDGWRQGERKRVRKTRERTG